MKGLATIILTTVLGLVGAVILSMLSRDPGEWHPVVAPPDPAVEILGHDEYGTTYLRTEGGVYACGMDREGAPECSKLDPQQMPEPAELCEEASAVTEQAPGEVADSLAVVCRGADVTIAIELAILTDGRVYEWFQTSGWFDVVDVIRAGFFGGVIGLIVGVIIVVARSTRRPEA